MNLEEKVAAWRLEELKEVGFIVEWNRLAEYERENWLRKYQEKFCSGKPENGTMTHDEIIAVVQAAKEGRTIECQAIGNNFWSETEIPSWDFPRFIYRVRPEPREFVVCVRNGWLCVQVKVGSAMLKEGEEVHVIEVLKK